MRSGLNDWIMLDLDGFRSTGFQICPKHLPLLWVYLAPLFDHIWLFLLPKSRVIEVPNNRFCKYPKKLFHHFSMWLARKYPRLTGWSQKKRAVEYSVDISPDEGMDVWIYSHVIFNLEFWHYILKYMMLYIITASLECFFPYSFPLSFRHGAGQALGGFADGGLSWRHVAWWQPQASKALKFEQPPKKNTKNSS